MKTDASHTLVINDLSVSENLDAERMTKIGGGMRKIPGKPIPAGLLIGPDGDPVAVYVDGNLVSPVGF